MQVKIPAKTFYFLNMIAHVFMHRKKKVGLVVCTMTPCGRYLMLHCAGFFYAFRS